MPLGSSQPCMMPHASCTCHAGHGIWSWKSAASTEQPLQPGRDSLPAGSHAAAMRTPSSSSEDQPWILLLSKAHVPDVPPGKARSELPEHSSRGCQRQTGFYCFHSMDFTFGPAKKLIMACEGLAHFLSIHNMNSLW